MYRLTKNTNNVLERNCKLLFVIIFGLAIMLLGTARITYAATKAGCNPATDGTCASCVNGTLTTNGCIPPNPDPAAKAGQCTRNACDLIKTYLNPTIDLLSGLVGVVTVISLVLGGVQYSMAAGDPQKSAAAKARIAKTIWALAAFTFLYAFLQFIIPGGILHPGS